MGCCAQLLASPPFKVLVEADGQKCTRRVMDMVIWPRSRGRSVEKSQALDVLAFLSQREDLGAWQEHSDFQSLLQAVKHEIVALSWMC